MKARIFRPAETFTAARRAPFSPVVLNRAYPSVAVGDGWVEVRLAGRRRLAFSDLAGVLRRGHVVTLVPRDGWCSFGARFPTREAAAGLFAALDARGAPAARGFVRPRRGMLGGKPIEVPAADSAEQAPEGGSVVAFPAGGETA